MRFAWTFGGVAKELLRMDSNVKVTGLRREKESVEMAQDMLAQGSC